MEWLLTPGEIARVTGHSVEWLEHGRTVLSMYMNVAKTQDAETKKKMVEWIEKHSFLEHNGDVRIPKEDWQALRKEVGLE